MDKDDVRYWLNVHSACRLKADVLDGATEIEADEDSFEWCLDYASLIRVCDEIAQAHEEDRADLDEAWQGTVDVLRGQVAEMRRLLGRSHGTLSLYSGGLQMRNPDHAPKLLEDIDKALQSAPTVLWSGKGQARQAGDNGKMILVDLPAGAFLLVDGTIYRRQEVDVIVLAETGTDALQGQSKAQEPACQAGAEHPEKSEQPWERVLREKREHGRLTGDEECDDFDAWMPPQE